LFASSDLAASACDVVQVCVVVEPVALVEQSCCQRPDMAKADAIGYVSDDVTTRAATADDVTPKDVDTVKADAAGYASDATVTTGNADAFDSDPTEAGYSSDRTSQSRGAEVSLDLKLEENCDETWIAPVEPELPVADGNKSPQARKKRRSSSSAKQHGSTPNVEAREQSQSKKPVKRDGALGFVKERERTEALLDQVMLFCASLVGLMFVANFLARYLHGFIAIMFPCCVASLVPAFLASSRSRMVRNFLVSLSVCVLALTLAQHRSKAHG
jgi:hypothetical protein